MQQNQKWHGETIKEYYFEQLWILHEDKLIQCQIKAVDFHNVNASVFPSLSYKIRHSPLGKTEALPQCIEILKE